MSNPNAVHLAPNVTFSELDWTPDDTTAAQAKQAQAMADAAAKSLATQTYVVTRAQLADFTWYTANEPQIKAAQMFGLLRISDE